MIIILLFVFAIGLAIDLFYDLIKYLVDRYV